MARNYYEVKTLADFTANRITSNEQEWKSFLTTAGRMSRYTFEEQMLIFAQRPDATAVASFDVWNNKMHCWINRGSEGIALLPQNSSAKRLNYVFDVSDVNEANIIGRKPVLWKFDRGQHQKPVMDALESIYGSTNIHTPFNTRVNEIHPIIKINSLYYAFESDKVSYAGIESFLINSAKKIQNFIKDNKGNPGMKIDPESISYANVRKSVFPRLLNTVHNKEYLRDVAHINFGDLSCVFYIKDIITHLNDGPSKVDPYGTCIATITNSFMSKLGIGIEDLKKDAINNVEALLNKQSEKPSILGKIESNKVVISNSEIHDPEVALKSARSKFELYS